jgi:hypothetical protein
MTILICLLSEQHVPNLLAVHHFKPDKLVLVETLGMAKRKASDNLLKALQSGGLDYSERCHVENLDQEDNLDAIRKSLHRAYSMYPSDDWIANITGGTKPMSIAAYEFFHALGARLVYVNAAAPNKFIGFDGKAEEICAYHPSIKEFLLGYGFDSQKKEEDIHESETRAQQWWNCARIIAARSQDPILLRFNSSAHRNQARDKGLDLCDCQFQAIPDLASAVKEHFGLQIENESFRGHLNKYAARFFTGEWLEIFIWGLLHQQSEPLNIWDVRLGLHPGKDNPRTENDFDVTFLREHSLSMIECKSGSQEHDPEVDALHKIEAVMSQFRALRVRSYLATTSANILDSEGKIKTPIANRASIYGCRIIAMDQIRKLACEPDNADSIRTIFFDSSGKN